jgi:hypothetical protein
MQYAFGRKLVRYYLSEKGERTYLYSKTYIIKSADNQQAKTL